MTCVVEMPTFTACAVRSAMPVCTRCSRPDSLPSIVMRVGFGFGLAEDLAVDHHGGVGGQHRQIACRCPDGLGLFARQAHHVFIGRLACARRLVDVGRRDHVRHADEV